MRILRLPEVSQATGLSRSTIYRLVRSGTFPHSVALIVNNAIAVTNANAFVGNAE